METARADITNFDGSVGTETLLHGSIPLLHILRGRMRVERSKADGCSGKRTGAQNWRTKVHPSVKERRRRSEIVRLLRLWKNERDVVALIAPGVLVHRSEEDSVRGMNDQAAIGQIPCDTETRGKVVLVRVHQSLRVAILPAYKNGRHTILEN